MKLWIYNQKWYKQLCDSKRFNNLCSDVVRRGNASNLARKSLQFSSFTSSFSSSSSSFGSFQCLITSKKKKDGTSEEGSSAHTAAYAFKQFKRLGLLVKDFSAYPNLNHIAFCEFTL
jgi:hypothetical protein